MKILNEDVTGEIAEKIHEKTCPALLDAWKSGVQIDVDIILSVNRMAEEKAIATEMAGGPNRDEVVKAIKES